ncbi:MAG: SDR family oxidoreductase [Conexivisphaerales archaeon]
MTNRISHVLVTGGAGFIGSHIAEGLLDRYDVGVVDNFVTGSSNNVKHIREKIRFFKADILDYQGIRKIVKEYDAVLHEAALASVTRSVKDPLFVNRTNVEGTLNLLKAAVDSGVERFIYASSSSVYGEVQQLPKREDMKPSPVSPYAVSKLCAENYCVAFYKVYGLKTVSLRYFNVYGPRQRGGVYSGVISKFITSLLRSRKPIIYGDGNQTRDFTYVNDVVKANLKCLKVSLKGGEVFNIATGKPTTITKLLSIISNSLGRKDVKPVFLPPRPGDVYASYADISKAKAELGFEPEYTLEEGIKEVVKWYRSQI